jgi:hypothetical protein
VDRRHDVVLDPSDPNVLYAATWQHHRTVAAYMGGGPESGIHKSSDGGETWQRLKTGLPSGNMGKIGLAISHQDTDVLYAAIELNRREGGSGDPMTPVRVGSRALMQWAAVPDLTIIRKSSLVRIILTGYTL